MKIGIKQYILIISALPKTIRKAITMILQFKVDESTVQAAWLKTLYDLIEELNCRCNTYLDERFNKAYKSLERTRTIEVYGSDTMVSWLKLRMERYLHFIDNYNNKPEIQILREKDVS